MTHPLYRSIAARFSLLLVVLACSPAALEAQNTLRPSWTCLSADTVAVARVPNAPAFIEAFRKQTRFGATLLAASRGDKIMEILTKSGKFDEEGIRRSLGNYNLNLDEWPKLFANELGVAVTLRDGTDIQPNFLVWFEPGEDLAGRLVLAAHKAIAEQEEGPFIAKRVDLELAGIPVTQVIFPIVAPDLSKLTPPNFPPNADPNKRLEQFRQFQAERARQIAEAPKVITGQTNVLFARLGGRIVAGLSSYSRLPGQAISEGADNVGLSGLDGLTQSFGRFLAVHASDGPNELAEVMQTPGFSTVSDQGVPLIEGVVNPRPIIRKGLESAPEEAKQQAQAQGAMNVGPALARMSLQGTILRTEGFWSLPEPRVGLFKIFDQTFATPDPPAWLPATLLDYTQINFDLAKAWAAIKETMLASGGPQAAQGIQQADATLNLMLQTDVSSLLSSFGDRHMILSFDKPPARLEDEGAAGDVTGLGDARVGFVWQTRDEALWKRILQLASASAAQFGGKPATEQGFSGLRIEQQGIQGGFFVGNGYIVLGLGDQVIETILSSLRSPPQGSASFRESNLASAAAPLIAAQPTLIYSIIDSRRKFATSTAGALSQYQTLANNPILASGDANVAATLRMVTELVQSILPTPEQAADMLNVGVDQLFITPQGLSLRSAAEYQAP